VNSEQKRNPQEDRMLEELRDKVNAIDEKIEQIRGYL
jgi:hypothetical protein